MTWADLISGGLIRGYKVFGLLLRSLKLGVCEEYRYIYIYELLRFPYYSSLI